MYENTGSRAHVMAAELIGAGIDVHAIYRRLYEGVPQGKLELLARGLSAVERFDGGLLTLTQLTREDYAVTGADESYSEGVVDHLRVARGDRRRRASCASCCPTAPRRAARSRCARPTTASTSRRSRARSAAAGTGARPASRPTWSSPSWSRSCARSSQTSFERPTASCSSTSPRESPRTTWWRRSGGGSARGAKVGHAGTLDPFATGLLLVLVGRATRAQRFLMALPKRYETVARLGFTSTTGDVDGEIAPGRMPPEPLALPTGRIRQRPPAYSARAGRRQARVRAGAGGRGGRAARARGRRARASSCCWRDGERAAFAIECGSGTYVRSLIADLGDAYCLELRRTGIGPFDVADAGQLRRRSPTRSRSCPRSSWRARTPGGPATASRSRRGGAAGTVRLLDGDGLIALAEPRGDGTLKPVVGFRG